MAAGATLRNPPVREFIPLRDDLHFAEKLTRPHDIYYRTLVFEYQNDPNVPKVSHKLIILSNPLQTIALPRIISQKA